LGQDQLAYQLTRNAGKAAIFVKSNHFDEAALMLFQPIQYMLATAEPFTKAIENTHLYRLFRLRCYCRAKVG